MAPSLTYFEEVSEGMELPILAKEPITPEQLLRYAGASGDSNPLHTVEEVGRKAGFGGIIAHGMLVMGFAAEFATRTFPYQSLRSLRVRFANVTRPGEPLLVSGRVMEKRPGDGAVVCGLLVRDAAGQVKLQGSFTVALPSRIQHRPT